MIELILKLAAVAFVFAAPGTEGLTMTDPLLIGLVIVFGAAALLCFVAYKIL